MGVTQRVQITLPETAYLRLLEISKDKGLSRSGTVALAIDKLWKEDYADKK